MRERPIIFSGLMVRAILDGRKTQTRRVVKPQCLSGTGWGVPDIADSETVTKCIAHFCPYGVPGDRLWVRETFQPLLADGVRWRDADYKTGEGYAPNYVATSPIVEFRDAGHDDEITPRCTPSIFMPRWASRITLEITDVRVQRLQEISKEDARAEGVEPTIVSKDDIADIQISDAAPQIKELARLLGPGQLTAKHNFSQLWDSINAKKHPWGSNPWVWALTFRRATA